MHVEGAQAILANTNPDMALVWDGNLRLYGLVFGGHMEYIPPDELRDMDEADFRTAVVHRLQRYSNSLGGRSDIFWQN